jgi:general stress protein 26
MEMNENEAKRFSLKLMETVWAVYFTTIDGKGIPHTRAMDNLRSRERFPKLASLFNAHKKDFLVLLSTNTSSTKMQHIVKNPQVAIYYCEPRQFHGVMLSGEIEIVKNLELKHALWHDYWTKYYPKGIDDPDYSILSLHPTQAEGWAPGRFNFTLRK